MKLKEIHELAVSMGMSHDPRGEKGIQKELDRQKRIYESLKGKEKDAFSLVMDFAQTTVRAGDKITYRVFLENSEDESYTLQHSLKPIYISVVKSEDFTSEKIVDSSHAETKIAPHGLLEEFFEFKPTEKGEYVLYAFADFSIEGKETTKDYEYECEKITITVV